MSRARKPKAGPATTAAAAPVVSTPEVPATASVPEVPENKPADVATPPVTETPPAPEATAAAPVVSTPEVPATADAKPTHALVCVLPGANLPVNGVVHTSVRGEQLKLEVGRELVVPVRFLDALALSATASSIEAYCVGSEAVCEAERVRRAAMPPARRLG